MARSKQEALAEAREEGFAPDQVKITRLLDLRYLHQGYTLAVECPAPLAGEEDKIAVKRAFDELHGRVYGQSAPREEAEIVTFRLQAEIEVPRLDLEAAARPATATAARALTGERPLFDLESDRFVAAHIYDRAKLLPGDRSPGARPSSTSSTRRRWCWQDKAATVDPYGILVIENEALIPSPPKSWRAACARRPRPWNTRFITAAIRRSCAN